MAIKKIRLGQAKEVSPDQPRSAPINASSDAAPSLECCASLTARCRLQGVNVTALREIKLLRELRSPYIVRLLDVFPHKHNLLLVR